MALKLGDIARHKRLGSVGLVIEDPKYKGQLVIQIHPYIFGKIIEEDWDLLENPEQHVYRLPKGPIKDN